MIIKLKADRINEGYMIFEISFESLKKQLNEQLNSIGKQIILSDYSTSTSEIKIKS